MGDGDGDTTGDSDTTGDGDTADTGDTGVEGCADPSDANAPVVMVTRSAISHLPPS